MHAWAEVDHDLVYKPLKGELSDEERIILDQLNGMILAGEIALELLQRAGEARVAVDGRRFENHYELAAHLIGRAATVAEDPVPESGLGRVDLLFSLISDLSLDTPELIAPYLETLHGNLEVRPLAEQVIDAILAEDPSRYQTYREIRVVRERAEIESTTARDETYAPMGFFLTQWIRLEQLLRNLVQADGTKLVVMPSARQLERVGIVDAEVRAEIGHYRQLRNQIVHGVEVMSGPYVEDAAKQLQSLVDKLEARPDLG